MTSISIRALNVARASIANHRMAARTIRNEAESIAAAKRRSPHLFAPSIVEAELADALREATAHERRADEIEAEHFAGLLSRAPEDVQAERESLRARIAASEVPIIQAVPDRWVSTKRRDAAKEEN